MNTILPEHFRSPRFYRGWMKGEGLVRFEARVLETDLAILAQRDLSREALERIVELRNDLSAYADAHEGFYAAMSPVAPGPGAPEIVKWMCGAADAWGVGPMAAVAGTFAEIVGEALLPLSPELIVENGGDIFIASAKPRDVGVYAGEKSPFAGKLTVRVRPESGIRGIATSSGTVGHSLSRGRADAVTAFAASAAFADAAATAVGNRVRSEADVDGVIEEESKSARLAALVIVIGGRMGIFGNIELVSQEA